MGKTGARQRPSGVTIVPREVAIGALEDVVNGVDYDDADGWKAIAAEAKKANVEVDHTGASGDIICDISDVKSGQRAGPKAINSTVKKSLFVTDTVMAQNASSRMCSRVSRSVECRSLSRP